jgi:hypothetical protein
VHDSICIVGGGIAGLYTAYKIKKLKPELSVDLYERLPQVGGKIQSGTFCSGSYKVEFGAVRIEPELQPLVDNLIKELNIEKVTNRQLTPAVSIGADLSLLSPDERAYLQAFEATKGMSFALLTFALEKILGDEWDIEEDRLFAPGRDKKKIAWKKNATFNGRLLRDQGIWNVFSQVLTYPAVEIVREKGAFYNLKNSNQNAAEWIGFLLDYRLLEAPSYVPVGGMETLTKNLLEAVKEIGVNVHLNEELVDICSCSSTTLNLKFKNTSSNIESQLQATRLVLALPQGPLLKLSHRFSKHVQVRLSAVVGVPMCWVYAVVANPPWGLGASTSTGEGIPARAAHFSLHCEEGRQPVGVVGLYCDAPWAAYWAALVDEDENWRPGEQIRPSMNVGHGLRETLAMWIQRMFELQHSPTIMEWGIRDWGSPPFDAGIHLWRPGMDSEEIMRDLSSFALCKKSTAQVSICGEAYSDVQGFLEGAIRSANRVVERIIQDIKGNK